MSQKLMFPMYAESGKKERHEKVVTAVQGCSRPLPWLHSHEGAFGTGLGLAHYRAQINHCTEPSKPCNHPACTFCKLLGFLLPLRRSCTRSPSQGADLYLHLLHLGTVLQHSMTGGHSPGFSLRMKPGCIPYFAMSWSAYAFYDQECGLWWVPGCGRALEAPRAN